MPLGDFPLKDRIVVVTGGATGIGLAFCIQCLSHGARIIIAGLSISPEAQDLLEKYKAAARFVKCDVAKWPDLQNLPIFSKKEFGAVPDVWVANAGIYEPAWSNFWDDTEDNEGHYAAVSINVEHPMKLTRIAIRSLLSENKKGVVLCVSSLSGLRSKYGSVLYCATKHAIVGFVKGMGLAEELEGVKVVAICPGRVHTPLWYDRDDLEQNFSYNESQTQTPDEMAAEMMNLVAMGKYRGGTILQVEKKGTKVAFEGIKEPEIFQTVGLPETKRVQGILNKERGKDRIL